MFTKKKKIRERKKEAKLKKQWNYEAGIPPPKKNEKNKKLKKCLEKERKNERSKK